MRHIRVDVILRNFTPEYNIHHALDNIVADIQQVLRQQEREDFILDVLIHTHIRGVPTTDIHKYVCNVGNGADNSDNPDADKRSEPQNSETCSICMEHMMAPAKTEVDELRGESIVRIRNCSHVYHFGCIKQWLVQNATCPLCKCDVTTGVNRAPEA